MKTIEDANSTPVRWQELLAVLLRQWRLIATVTILGTLACVAVLLLRAPVYEANAHLAVVPERARIIVSPDPKTGTLTEGVTEQDLNSEVALLRSDQLLREVLREGLAVAGAGDAPTPSLFVSFRRMLSFPGRLYRSMHGVPDSDALEYEVREVRENLDIQGIKGSNLIRISYREDNPEHAAGLVNALAERHVRRPSITSQDEARLFFEKQRELLYESRQKAEIALRAFYERENIGSLPQSTDALRASLIKLQADAVKAETQMAEAEARATFLRQELERQPKTAQAAAATGQSDPLQFIRTRIVDLELQRSNLIGQFAPTSSKIKDIDRQLAEARRLMQREQKTKAGVVSQTRESLALSLAKTEAEAVGLKARIASMRAQIEQDQPRLVHLEQIASERERLEQEVASAREALQTYRRKEEEARFSSALDRSRIVNVSVVEPARVPSAPLPAARMATVMVGAVFSLIIGVAFAFLRDRFDPTLKSITDVAEVGRAPVLADMTY
ncbi:MAG TPA: GumC family protein [Terriglobales bacterium]|nr:GumC family protein [Terriglobales bacterium]